MAAARQARRSGARTLLVQDGPIGGDCTFTGCVPSKTLLAAAADGLDFGDAMRRVGQTVERIAATETAEVFRGEGIDVVTARARFTGPHDIEADGARFRSPRFVLATGARPLLPPLPGIESIDVLTSENVFELTDRPKRLIVIGGGPIGCELGQAMRRLGSEVVLIEALPRVLPLEDPEASEVIAAALRHDGVELRLGALVTRVERSGHGVRVVTEDGDVAGDRLLVAVGREPRTGLDLHMAGVLRDRRGYIVTDDRLRTSATGIFAAGDVTGRLPLTHAADYMGRLAAANALRRRRGAAYDESAIPRVTFTHPEVASVGMSEAEAAEHGGRVAYLPMAENDRAVAEGRTDGFIKLIAGPRRLLRQAGGGKVLGASIVGPRAGELIHEPAIAIRTGMFAGRLAQVVHAYPTWSMAVQKAAAQLFMEIDGRTARPARASER